MRPTIESGAMLAHYRVIAPLGAGGMGEVYKAHDNTLERTVALKILPPDLVRNEERVRRFMQEARSASSLNHPHIVTIHEIGESRLSTGDETPIHYIAMELVDGFTLRKKIHDEGTDLRTLLTYLAQAAEGLSKAHGAGIVHRDLKPDNIMVTRDGFAKVLDFGLAKLQVKKSAPEGHTQATAVREETREGAVLGTVAYMSPEQVQGKPADHRSDIFAFGAILYEAATRQRPFAADSDVDVMHKILHDKPVPIDEINPTVPAELRRLIRRCLAKDPDRRVQSMKDIALELGEIVDEFDELSLASSTRNSSSISGPVAPPRDSRTMWVAGSLLGLIAIAAVTFGFMQWRAARTKAAAPSAFASMKLERLTSSGNIQEAAISPDGKYIAHVTRDEGGQVTLWVRQVATGSDVRVLPPENALGQVTFSPDGNYLYYATTPDATYRTLYQIPALGGTPRKVLFDVDTPPAFSADGKQFAFMRGHPPSGKNLLLIANADGSGERQLTAFQRFGNPYRAAWSRDGKKVITPVVDIAGGWHTSLVEVDVTSGAQRTVGSSRWFDVGDPAFRADGSAVVMTAVDTEAGRSQLWIQPYPDGKPVRITNDLNNYHGCTLTADGAMVAAIQDQSEADLRVAEPGDETGGSVFTATPNQRPWSIRTSQSGAAVYAFTSGSVSNIAIIDGPGAPPRTLTTDGASYEPTITGDGKTIVFLSEKQGAPHVFAIDADGSNLRQITRGAGEIDPTISADGRTLVYGTTSGLEIWTMPLAGGAPRKLTDRANGAVGVISPDGKWVAFQEWHAAGQVSARRLKIAAIDGGKPILDIPWRGGAGRFRWHPDGKRLTFWRNAGGAAQIFAMPITGGEPTQLTRFKKGFISGYDWMPDGKLVMSRGTTRSDVVLISNYR